VKGRGIVEGRGAQSEEVFGGLGCGLAEELELDVALGGVQLQDVLVSLCMGKHGDMAMATTTTTQKPDAPVRRAGTWAHSQLRTW
jgi:hypothetical protein